MLEAEYCSRYKNLEYLMSSSTCLFQDLYTCSSLLKKICSFSMYFLRIKVVPQHIPILYANSYMWGFCQVVLRCSLQLQSSLSNEIEEAAIYTFLLNNCVIGLD
jgi:hypothetical protein